MFDVCNLQLREKLPYIPSWLDKTCFNSAQQLPCRHGLVSLWVMGHMSWQATLVLFGSAFSWNARLWLITFMTTPIQTTTSSRLHSVRSCLVRSAFPMFRYEQWTQSKKKKDWPPPHLLPHCSPLFSIILFFCCADRGGEEGTRSSSAGDQTRGFSVSGKASKCRHPPHISEEGWRCLLAHLQRRLSGIWPMVRFHQAVKATLVRYDTQFDTFPLRMAPWKPYHCCYDLYFWHPLQTEESTPAEVSSFSLLRVWNFFAQTVRGSKDRGYYT